MNITAVAVFTVFVVLTLWITARASRRSHTTRGFYAAEGQVGGFVNGVAITGDFLSAATFLGITGLLFSAGLDTAFYLMAPLLGLSIMLFALAKPFRRLGRFTIGDVVAYRLDENPIRTFAAVTSLVIVLFYLIVQFVGAGKLMQGLFGINFRAAVLVAGFGAAAILPDYPQFYMDGKLIGGNNMVALHLSNAIGGSMFFGFVSTVIFATILAVVSGLILAGASAFSHDLYTHVFRGGKIGQKEELRVTRIAIFTLGGLGVLLAFVFEQQNIAYMATLAFAVSASTNFPVLILSLYWHGLTTRGVVIGGGIGLLSTVTLLFLGPTVWVEVMGHATPIFPYKYPALITSPLAFVAIYLVSRFDGSPRATLDQAGFEQQWKVAFGNTVN